MAFIIDDIISELVGKAVDKSIDKLDHNEARLQILNKFGLKPDASPNNFDGFKKRFIMKTKIFLSINLMLLSISLSGCNLFSESVSSQQYKAHNLAHNILGSLNKGQEYYRQEKGVFTDNFKELNVGIFPEQFEKSNYLIKMKVINNDTVQTLMIPKKENLKAYTGGVFAIESQDKIETITIICESIEPNQDLPLAPKLSGIKPICPSGFLPL